MEIDNDNVLCPYCQAKCGDYESFDGSSGDEHIDFECEECGKKFTAERCVTVDYRSEKDCSMNNEEHEAGQYHCTKCDVYNCHFAQAVNSEVEDRA